MADNEHASGADETDAQRDSSAPYSGDNDVTAAQGSPVLPEPPQPETRRLGQAQREEQGRQDPGGDWEQPVAPGQQPPQHQQITSTGGLSVFGDGRYRLTRRLGRGGMAEVFGAQDARLGRTVAIKVLRPDLAEDAIARMRFTREAHAVASLNHHAVVAVYDTGEEAHGQETVPYIVMELVEGHTVRELSLIHI